MPTDQQQDTPKEFGELLCSLDRAEVDFWRIQDQLLALPEHECEVEVLLEHFRARCAALDDDTANHCEEGARILVYLTVAHIRGAPSVSGLCKQVLLIERLDEQTIYEVCYLWAIDSMATRESLQELLQFYRRTIATEQPASREDAIVSGILNALYLESIVGGDMLDGLPTLAEESLYDKWGPMLRRTLLDVEKVRAHSAQYGSGGNKPDEANDALVVQTIAVFVAQGTKNFALPLRPPVFDRWVLSRCREVCANDISALDDSCAKYLSMYPQYKAAINALQAWLKRP